MVVASVDLICQLTANFPGERSCSRGHRARLWVYTSAGKTFGVRKDRSQIGDSG